MTALRGQGLSDEALDDAFERYQREHHALAMAVERGDADEVDRALADGADPHSVDTLGSPVLHIAAALGHVEIMRLLIDSGADVNLRDEFMGTALILAANGADRAAVELLLERGADPTMRNDLGESAEDRADRTPYGDPSLVPLLRDAAARRSGERPVTGPRSPADDR
ncbi:MAG: ankyrin repeat domain-containing protein [Sandaracinaceae bacterium]